MEPTEFGPSLLILKRDLTSAHIQTLDFARGGYPAASRRVPGVPAAKWMLKFATTAAVRATGGGAVGGAAATAAAAGVLRLRDARYVTV